MKKAFEKFVEIWNGKVLFIPRLIAWIVCVGIIPVLLINSQFVLFTRNTEGIDFNAWGLIAVLILAITTYAIIGYIVKAFEYSFFIQILNGVRKVLIWIALAYFACQLIVDNIYKIQYILKWSFVSVAIGIIINPLPRWSYKFKYKRIKEEMNSSE